MAQCKFEKKIPTGDTFTRITCVQEAQVDGLCYQCAYEQLKAKNALKKRGLRAILALHKEAGAMMNANYSQIAGQMATLAEEYLYKETE